MDIQGSRVLVLGGSGLVGMAVCRELLRREPETLIVHGRRPDRAEAAVRELESRSGDTRIAAATGDIFSLRGEPSERERVLAQVRQLRPGDLDEFTLYRLLADSRADIVVDCVNTATGIAYRDLFKATERVAVELDRGEASVEGIEHLLESLYVPRLIRHVQIMYRGMTNTGTRVYIKVGTSGTGGMGFNIPYTHSEERPSRMLLSKSAVAGAHSMLLFLMARTPGAPVTKEIKPAAAIAWKQIAAGPIYRRGVPVRMVDAAPRPLGDTFSTHDPGAATERDDILTTAYIDTGENGIFSVEEFATLTTSEQMEFVTPEEIAQYLVFEIEGGNTGHDIVNALDNAVLGPSYRAGLMRHWALEQLNALERDAGTRSVAFEMLGPPHVTKLLFESHLLREAFGTMTALRDATPADVERRLVGLVREQPEIANEVAAVGIPMLLPGNEIIRGIRVIVPADADNEPVVPETLERWVEDGWVDLRRGNCQRWIERFQRIHDQIDALPEGDTSSAHLRTTRFWDEERRIQPGKVVAWVLSVEEHGTRIKD
jgi:hypothetical protein